MASKLSKNVSLADKISDLLTTKPQHSDDDEEEASAKLTENIEEFAIDEEKEPSIFRKRNAALLEDLDERYAGKKSSRKKLGQVDIDDFDENDELGLSNFEENDEIDSDSESDNIVSDQEESGSKIDEDEGSEESEEHDEVEFQHLDESKSTDSSKNKGQSVRNQLLIWESLLEMRIQFQKCLIAANKMPRKNAFTDLAKNELEFSKKVSETNKTISGTLTKLLELQNVVARQFPETKNIYKADLNLKRKALQKAEDSDEEIPSDTDPENDSEPEIDATPVKKQKLDLKVELNTRHYQYTDYRNSVIQKWNDKTRLAVASKNATNSHSVVNQIKHNLSDKSKLIKKTQLKRSQYNILGESPPQNLNDSKTDEEIDSKVAEEYNNNIFDDDDFYHHLLRELIEVKSADLTDPVQLGRQWIQLQNLRSKMKRKIDTKATKGRKIRYAVHSKLVNFMAPIDDCFWSHEAKNELYSSLFGKK